MFSIQMVPSTYFSGVSGFSGSGFSGVSGFSGITPSGFSGDEIRQAADEMLEDFEDYREESITEAMKNASMKPRPEDLVMTPEDIEYAKKQEKMVEAVGVSTLPNLLDHPVNISVEEARKAGIEHIRGYMPVSASRIRQALERGDKHLNTIPIRKWDEAAKQMGYRHIKTSLASRMSLSDAVGVLKHVARWHYA